MTCTYASSIPLSKTDFKLGFKGQCLVKRLLKYMTYQESLKGIYHKQACSCRNSDILVRLKIAVETDHCLNFDSLFEFLFIPWLNCRPTKRKYYNPSDSALSASADNRSQSLRDLTVGGRFNDWLSSIKLSG